MEDILQAAAICPSFFSIAIIVLLILKKIKFITFLSLFIPSYYALVIGYFLIHKLPERVSQGPNIPYLPIVIGIIISCLAILCLFIHKLSNRAPNRPFKFRWILLVLGEIVLLIGLSFALVALYRPNIFGSRVPLASLACLVWLSCIIIASFFFYKVAKMNSDDYPNLMRYVVFVFTYFSFTYTLVLSGILIYAVTWGKISYVFWGAIITLGFLPPSLVMLGIAKDHIPAPLLGSSISAPHITQKPEG